MLVGGTLNCAKEKKYYTIVQDGRRHIVLNQVSTSVCHHRGTGCGRGKNVFCYLLNTLVVSLARN